MSLRSPFRRAAARPILIVLLAVLAGVGVYTGAIRENLAPKNFGVVAEGRVYRSGQLTPSAMRAVHDRYHIKTVIDLGSYWDGDRGVSDPRGDRRNQQVAGALGMTRYVLPLFGDGTGNLNRYVQALGLMTDPANQPVLVHCGAGSERTGVLVALYENMAQATPLEGALKETTHFRHDPRRNPHVEEIVRIRGTDIINACRTGTQLNDPANPSLPPPRPVNAHAPADG